MPKLSRPVRSVLPVLLCVAALAWGAPGSAVAAPRSVYREGGLGYGSAFLSLFYTPVKVIYATAGFFVAGGAYVVTGGRKDIYDTILNPAWRGDYVITPEHLTMERRLVFVGPYPEQVADERARESERSDRDRDRDLPEQEEGGSESETEPYPF
jgi:hypothetical protein